MENYKAFFAKYSDRIVFVAPSICCGNIWREVYREFSDRVLVIPHQDLVGQYIQNIEPIKKAEPIKIAFVGMQRNLKGWKEWVDVCEIIGNNPQIQLFHFGGTDEGLKNVKHVSVNYNVEKESMVYQLRREKIQCAVLWSKVPETYSYTYYEAFSSNCYVLTNTDSGNIADQIEIHKNGYVCSQNEGLKDIISDVDRLRGEINHFRNQKKYGPDHLQINSDIIEILEKSVLDRYVMKKAPRFLEFRLIGNSITKLYCFVKDYKREDLFHL